jgi:bile acid-coenzyme A ligase
MRAPAGAAPSYRYRGALARARDGWESLGDLGWMMTATSISATGART